MRSVPGSKIRTIEDKPGSRLGADSIQPRHAVQQVLLHRNSDQLFHFLRRKPQGFGLNLHIWRRELGQDIYWRTPKLGDTKDHQHDCDSNDQETQFKNAPNE